MPRSAAASRVEPLRSPQARAPGAGHTLPTGHGKPPAATARAGRRRGTRAIHRFSQVVTLLGHYCFFVLSRGMQRHMRKSPGNVVDRASPPTNPILST